MIRILLLLGALFLYTHAWADPSFNPSNPQAIGQFFNADNTSVQMLSGIFGPISDTFVSGWDGSTPLTPLNAMFREFNNAMLVLSMIVLIYGTLFGIINTANEGEFLGKSRNSLWIPIRSVFSVVLLIPNSYGYCILQVIVMWIVLQGTGAADNVWNAALSSLLLQGTPEVAAMDQSFVNTQSVSAVRNLFQASVCRQMYAQADDVAQGKKYVPVVAPVAKNIKAAQGQSAKIAYTFDINGAVVSGPCGTYTMTDPAQYSMDQSTDHGKYFSLFYVNQAMPTILQEVNADAIYFVQNLDNVQSGQAIKNYPYDPNSIVETFSDAITNARNDYQKAAENNPTDNKMQDHMRQLGWVYAGAFYRELIKYKGMFTDVLGKDVPISQVAQTVQTGAYTQDVATAAANTFSVVAPDGSMPALDPTWASFNLGDIGKNGSPLSMPINVIGDWIVMGFITAITGDQSSIIIDGKVVTNEQDPILSLQIFGNKIITIIEFAWTVMLGLAILMGVLSLCPVLNPFFALIYILFKVMGVMMMVLGLLFVFAMTMSVYIPMIPYIIFFFGVIGWVVAVLEAMLSAPLVAMAMADVHHEGGGIWGRASLAFMLILGVFIRPVFMIFGLIGGMLVSRVAIHLLNASFEFVMLDTADVNFSYTNSDDFGYNEPLSGQTGHKLLSPNQIGPFQLVGYISIYLSIVVIIVNKCFSLINTIPDQVLRWIGSSHQFGTFGSEAASAMDSKAQESMGQIGKTGSEIGTKAAQEGEKFSGVKSGKIKKDNGGNV